MALAGGALDAAGARCVPVDRTSSHLSASQPRALPIPLARRLHGNSVRVFLERDCRAGVSGNSGRVFLGRYGRAGGCGNSGGVSPERDCRAGLYGNSGRVFMEREGTAAGFMKGIRFDSVSSSVFGRDSLERKGLFRVQSQMESEGETETLKVKAESGVETEAGNGQAESEVKTETMKSDRKNIYADLEGVDEDGYLVNTSLPKSMLDLMKEKPAKPNYWAIGAGLLAVFITHKAIGRELKGWGNLLILAGLLVVDLVVAAFAKLVKLGGDPLIVVIVNILWVVLTINNVCRYISRVTPVGPVMFGVTLASLVLLVGESVSDTYSSVRKEFPSRNVLDCAGVLGLAAFVGAIPVEFLLVGLLAITTFLLAVKRVNPVAGFTPAAAVLAAVSTPKIRYSVLLAFIGSCSFRYWKLGYFSQGAVTRERNAEYPRLLIGLIYLVAFAFVARSFFYCVDTLRFAIALARA